MIELKHLRQGNWILAGLDKQPVQVAEILADSVNTTLLKHWTPEMIAPIPLSPEILDTLHIDYMAELSICVSYKEGRYWVEHEYMDTRYLGLVSVEYVHELQNVFHALTKAELPINL